MMPFNAIFQPCLGTGALVLATHPLPNRSHFKNRLLFNTSIFALLHNKQSIGGSLMLVRLLWIKAGWMIEKSFQNLGLL